MDRQCIALGWTETRLNNLRGAMEQQGLDMLIVPRWDAHQSEYVIARDERLAWATGFSGSWGLAIVTLTNAAIFIDGRYTVQAEQEVDTRAFQRRHLYDQPPVEWLREHCDKGTRIGFDPMVVPPQLYLDMKHSLSPIGVVFHPLSQNPIDLVWTDRPEEPHSEAFAFSEQEAGESVASKCGRMATALSQKEVDLWVETQCDNLAWLLNIRGRDVPENPFLQGFALISNTGHIDFFTDIAKLDPKEPFEFERVNIHPKDDFAHSLEARLTPQLTLGVDPRFGPSLAVLLAEKCDARISIAPSPLTALKAIKNTVEVKGMTKAGLLDAEVLVELFIWLDDTVPIRSRTDTPVTEKEVEEKLNVLRQNKDGYVEPSFIPISASGANGAMCHYNAPVNGSAPLGGDEIFLLDTGGQYRSGTTDTTRTIIFGEPSEEQKEAYTMVLKGHIALASQRFPAGTRGYQLDVLARQYLWKDHRDYDHGTGHGVGHFLCVHEHPQRLGKEPLDIAIEAGMNLTIEPGFYVVGEYGIRIENLYQVVETEKEGWLSFEPLMFFPIGRQMLKPGMLTGEELVWLNAYHAETKRKLIDNNLSEKARLWLQHQTAPIFV